MIIKILLGLLILFIVILSHEFGHFIIAKMNGIRVVEFAIGMGPKLLKFGKKDTIYTIRLLPIGGACIFDQEDGYEASLSAKAKLGSEEQLLTEEEMQIQETSVQEEQESAPLQVKGKAFTEAPILARLTTVLAGPIFNFLLAWVMAIFIVLLAGSTNTKITGLIEDYPAMQAGVQVGDEIISLNGERVYIYDEVSLFSQLNEGDTVEMKVNRGGEIVTLTIQPKYSEEEGRYYIGFTGGQVREKDILSVLSGAYYEVRYWIKMTIKSLIMLFTGKASVNDMAGPVGVATIVSDVYDQASAFGFLTVVASMLNIAILLSANLGVINLLPIPAMDGGRILFLLIELVRGKPIPKEKEAIVHFIGFVLLMMLMVFVFYNDFARLFARCSG